MRIPRDRVFSSTSPEEERRKCRAVESEDKNQSSKERVEEQEAVMARLIMSRSVTPLR
jgi:hypothetical protein